MKKPNLLKDIIVAMAIVLYSQVLVLHLDSSLLLYFGSTALCVYIVASTLQVERERGEIEAVENMLERLRGLRDKLEETTEKKDKKGKKEKKEDE